MKLTYWLLLIFGSNFIMMTSQNMNFTHLSMTVNTHKSFPLSNDELLYDQMYTFMVKFS